MLEANCLGKMVTNRYDTLNDTFGSFHDQGRYICTSVVREKSLEQTQNKKQSFPYTLIMTDRC